MSRSEPSRHLSESGDEAGPTDRHEKAIFGAGCFWGVEASFRRLEGVVATRVGYAGGTWQDPTYQEVCSGT